MTNKNDSGDELRIDSDWKAEAAREKAELAEKAVADVEQSLPDHPKAAFIELFTLLATQAGFAIGGYTGPDGQQIPRNPMAAKHFLELLCLLQEKTHDHLTDREEAMLAAIIRELREQLYRLVGRITAAAGKAQQQ